MALLELGEAPELPRFFITSATLRACFDIPLEESDAVRSPASVFAFDLLDWAHDNGLAGEWSTRRIVVDASGDPWVAAVERSMHVTGSGGRACSERVIFGVGFGPNRPDPVVNFEASSRDDIVVPRDDAVWLVSFIRRFCLGLERGALRLAPGRTTLSRPVRRALGNLVADNAVASVVPVNERLERPARPPALVMPVAHRSSPWRDAALLKYGKARGHLAQGLLVP